MDYLISFDSRLDPDRLAASLTERWAIPLAQILIDKSAAPGTYEGPPPVAGIEHGNRPSSDFDVQLTAYKAFVAVWGVSKLCLATTLCMALDTRALISDGSGVCRMLITEDGWHGWVVLRDGVDGMVIDYALHPVPVAPAIPVKPTPDWHDGADLYTDRGTLCNQPASPL